MRKALPLTAFPQESSYDYFDSPVGQLVLIASNQGLHAVLWDTDALPSPIKRTKNFRIILDTQVQLSEYFLGQRKSFDLPLKPVGTDFQKEAWSQLLQIPYGQTLSYGKQAERMGDKNKARAVGMANGKNPISIIIPCHRVIGSNGHLTGFAGGLDKKQYLLNLERKKQKES